MFDFSIGRWSDFLPSDIKTHWSIPRIKIIPQYAPCACARSPAYKPVSRPMVDDNLYPGIEAPRQNPKREREREEKRIGGEKERGNLHSSRSRSTRFRSPLLALENLCNLISGWERVIPLHYFIKRLNHAWYDHIADIHNWNFPLNVNYDALTRMKTLFRHAMNFKIIEQENDNSRSFRGWQKDSARDLSAIDSHGKSRLIAAR